MRMLREQDLDDARQMAISALDKGQWATKLPHLSKDCGKNEPGSGACVVVNARIWHQLNRDWE